MQKSGTGLIKEADEARAQRTCRQNIKWAGKKGIGFNKHPRGLMWREGERRETAGEGRGRKSGT